MGRTLATELEPRICANPKCAKEFKPLYKNARCCSHNCSSTMHWHSKYSKKPEPLQQFKPKPKKEKVVLIAPEDQRKIDDYARNSSVVKLESRIIPKDSHEFKELAELYSRRSMW